MLPINSKHSRLGRILTGLASLIPRSAVVRVVGGPLRGWKWISGSLVHRCWLGLYEREQVLLFAAAARDASVVFDVGANVGYYSMIAAKRVGPGGQVHAFEPNSSAAVLLEEHVRLNRATNVVIHRTAIADTVGELKFWDGAGAESHLAEDGPTTVRSDTLDSMLAENALPPPDLMKIDVEGAEFRVLLGAESILRTARPSILIEVHGDPEAECLPHLRSFGYDIAMVDSHTFFATPGRTAD